MLKLGVSFSCSAARQWRSNAILCIISFTYLYDDRELCRTLVSNVLFVNSLVLNSCLKQLAKILFA